MPAYYRAFFLDQLGNPKLSEQALKDAAGRSPLYCFPNRLEDIAVLRFAIRRNPEDARAPYYLGCLFYDKRGYQQAQELWEASARLDADFPTVWRNLALIYFNQKKNPEAAREAMEKAFALDPSDARVLMELDQLYRKLGVTPEERLSRLQAQYETVCVRDDLYTEFITLLNLTGHHREAYDRIMSRRFHPWEGGEGKVPRQYVAALSAMAEDAMEANDFPTAISMLKNALTFPHNLGEGKLEGQKDNDLYYRLGIALRRAGREAEAAEAFRMATAGDSEPAGAMYYNDQPADMILYKGLAYRELGDGHTALSCFHKLVDYGEKHLFDAVKIEYFAVSLPELQLFEEDLSRRNRIHCTYLIGLGSLGLGDLSRAEQCFEEAVQMDPAHAGARLMKNALNRLKNR